MSATARKILHHDARLTARNGSLRKKIESNIRSIDFGNIKRNLKNATREVEDTTMEVRKAVRGYTRQNPLMALGISTLVGVALGFLLRR